MRVIKIGGTSVGEYHSIEQICYILRDKKNKEDRYAIIVSAIGSITEKLVKCALYAEQTNEKFHFILDEIEIQHFNIILDAFTGLGGCIISVIKYINNLSRFYETIYKYTFISKISLEKIINFGELISSVYLNEKIKEFGCYPTWKDSRYLIVIDNQYESAQVNFTKSVLNIKSFLIKENTPYIILPGFIASSTVKETSLLRRGGSDYSASIFSAALQAEFMEIWTDVSGIMTALPKIVLKSFTLDKLSYLEAMELSNFGTSVIYYPTLLSSMKKNIPVMIKNTLSPLEIGTFIFGPFKSVITKIAGIPYMQNITLLTLERNLDMPGCPNFLIKQRNSVPSLYIEILREFSNEINTPYYLNNELGLITVIVIDYMKNIPVTSGSMLFSAFGLKSINLRVIISTENFLYAVIEKKLFKISMITLHEIFFEPPYKKIHIFIARLGQVVNSIILQFHKQKDYLVDELHIHIRVIGICNRNRIILNYQGINITPINNLKPKNIKLVTSTDIEEFIVKLYKLNLCNSIFIDNTDRKEIGNLYIEILRKGIAIITFNNVACASSYYEDKKIKNIARYFKAPFFFEPNVAIGLIKTLIFGIVKSADKIFLMDARLSVSLNLIFKKGYFIDIVSESQRRGFTEFDIRLDLSGIDVIRKNLIIVRECSEDIELEDIKQISLLPKSCIKAFTIDSFYQELTANEEFFTQLHLGAKEQRKRINFMAKYKYGKTYVGIEYISFNHTFFLQEAKNSMILYTTELEPNIIVKEAVITAYGVFSDIIKTVI